ncbi:MAG: ATP-dependent zinc metalloprotease FtsH [Anaerolineales bacterium]|nr:ATP-dependent zinc metalloprotease FtsH [Anaerolineales bacterium]
MTQPPPEDKPPVSPRIKYSAGAILTTFLIVFLLQQFVIGPWLAPSIAITYSDFKTALRADQLKTVEISDLQITGTRQDATAFSTVRVEDPGLLAELEAHGVAVQGQLTDPSGGLLGVLLGWVLPLALIGGLTYWSLQRMKSGGGGAGGGIFSFGKSKARAIQGKQTGVTFQDVGGVGEAATDLREVIEFLKNPTHFQRLGGKMPKGVLLVGPPGTGKTLLARATAGEAGVPFFSISGAEFVEMFVGVGASRVRDLFDQAKKAAPCIVFIDEIDAIGGRRAGAGALGVHEEREQTLNQLLAEMDGFETSRGVILMAATNRLEVLDPALLRPGRFDRQIMVDLADLAGREEILRIHVRGVTLAPGLDVAALARITPGFSGADLANIVNEAALLAARHDKAAVEMSDFDEAIERVMAGAERRNRVMNPHEKEVVAAHEAGHALLASLLPGMDRVHKVTVVPRGRALGYTWQRPTEDRFLLSEHELQARLIVLLGGRVAEALTFGEISTGAADDLARATDLARRMVTEYGMSPALGPVRLAADPQAAYLGQAYGLDARVSQTTSALVDVETRRLVEEAVVLGGTRLAAHRTALDRLAARLYEQETVASDEIEALLSAWPAGARQPENGALSTTEQPAAPA